MRRVAVRTPRQFNAGMLEFVTLKCATSPVCSCARVQVLLAVDIR